MPRFETLQSALADEISAIAFAVEKPNTATTLVVGRVADETFTATFQMRGHRQRAEDFAGALLDAEHLKGADLLRRLHQIERNIGGGAFLGLGLALSILDTKES